MPEGDNHGASVVWQTLSNSIQRAINLRIVTVVGDAKITGSLEQLTVEAPAQPGSSLVTNINLIEGDITTILGDKMLDADSAELRALHQAAVAHAQDIIERNVKMLVSVVKEIGEQLGALPPPQPRGALPPPQQGH